MWVEFVVGSCPCSEGFPLGSLVFPLHKNQHHTNTNLALIHIHLQNES